VYVIELPIIWSSWERGERDWVVFFSSQIYTWDALRIPLKKRKWGERKENPPFFSKHPQHSHIKGHNRVEIYKGVSHKKNSGPLWKKTKEKGKRTLFLVTEKGGGRKRQQKHLLVF
jgi:hypothetical protein